jgi:hypothetical protein
LTINNVLAFPDNSAFQWAGCVVMQAGSVVRLALAFSWVAITGPSWGACNMLGSGTLASQATQQRPIVAQHAVVTAINHDAKVSRIPTLNLGETALNICMSLQIGIICLAD